MSNKNKVLAKLGLTVLIGGLFIFATTRTLHFVQTNMTAADDQMSGYLFLLTTGAGAFIWLYVMLNLAEGAKQRAVAMLMAVIDLGGEIALAVADMFATAGQNGAIKKMAASEMEVFIYVAGGLVLLNIAAGFLFHFWDPETEAAEKARDIADNVSDAAFKMLNNPAMQQQMIAQLAPTLMRSVIGNVAQTISAQAGMHAGDGFGGMQITMGDGETYDIPAAQKKQEGLLDGLASKFGFERKRTPDAKPEVKEKPAPFPIVKESVTSPLPEADAEKEK